MAPNKKRKSRTQLTVAERAYIKAEQAGFVEKINTAEANEHQQAIFEAAQSQQGRYVVLAGPGSGKTFSSIKASTFFTGSAIYFAYNKKIQMDTTSKLIALDSRMAATTTHAFGLGCLQAYNRGQCVVDDKGEKYSDIIAEYLTQQWESFVKSIEEEIEDTKADVEVMRLDARTWTKHLLHYAQVNLLDPVTASGLSDLVDEFDLNEIKRSSLVWPFVTRAVRHVLEEGLQRFLGPEHLLNYDDMLY